MFYVSSPNFLYLVEFRKFRKKCSELKNNIPILLYANNFNHNDLCHLIRLSS